MKEKTVHVRLRLPELLHSQIKSTAAVQRQPLHDFLVMQIARSMITFKPKGWRTNK